MFVIVNVPYQCSPFSKVLHISIKVHKHFLGYPQTSWAWTPYLLTVNEITCNESIWHCEIHSIKVYKYQIWFECFQHSKILEKKLKKKPQYGDSHVNQIGWKGSCVGSNNGEAINMYKGTYDGLFVSTIYLFIYLFSCWWRWCAIFWRSAPHCPC